MSNFDELIAEAEREGFLTVEETKEYFEKMGIK